MTTYAPKLTLTLPDYERIFQTIHGVLRNERCEPERACLYFGVIGVALLEKYHRVKARPVVGMAAYRLDGSVLAFASHGTSLCTTGDGFHCWVEANGVAIDFQAPLFREVVAPCSSAIELPRKMMQKRLDQANGSFDSLSAAGTHWYQADDELRRSLLTDFMSKQANIDLAQICVEWYKPTPKKMKPHIHIGDQHGQVKLVPLSQLRINGAW